MTQVEDGPAAGVSLLLRRAPLYLRLVFDLALGTWDALDQVDDDARTTETITIYRRVGQPTWMHMRASRGRGGVYRGGRYRVVSPQPTDPEVRTSSAWQRWVMSQPDVQPAEDRSAS